MHALQSSHLTMSPRQLCVLVKAPRGSTSTGQDGRGHFSMLCLWPFPPRARQSGPPWYAGRVTKPPAWCTQRLHHPQSTSTPCSATDSQQRAARYSKEQQTRLSGGSRPVEDGLFASAPPVKGRRNPGSSTSPSPSSAVLRRLK